MPFLLLKRIVPFAVGVAGLAACSDNAVGPTGAPVDAAQFARTPVGSTDKNRSCNTAGSPTRTSAINNPDKNACVAGTFYLAANGITIMCPTAAAGERGIVNGVEYTKRARGDITTANAPTTCTSGISDMSYLFANAATFDGNISHWDTGDVTNMSAMFFGASAFNQPIAAWNTALVGPT